MESDNGAMLMVRSISGGGEIRLKCVDGHVNGVMFMETMLMMMVSLQWWRARKRDPTIVAATLPLLTIKSLKLNLSSPTDAPNH